MLWRRNAWYRLDAAASGRTLMISHYQSEGMLRRRRFRNPGFLSRIQTAYYVDESQNRSYSWATALNQLINNPFSCNKCIPFH